MKKKQVKQSRFMSINYSRVVCEGCNEETIIEPGTEFHGLNCSCKIKAPKLDDKEISTPVTQELDYFNKQTIIVIGMFKDGDYEVCNGNDLSDTWRVPKVTFENTYVLVPDIPEGNTPDDEVTPLSKEILDAPEDGSRTANLVPTLEDLKGKSVDEIKDAYTMDQLRILAKSVKIRGASNMGEQKLVERLLTKVN